MNADYAIIGGGVVGLSVAWGLLRRGRRVIVLDGEDGSFRASRGNFGLIWVQGKGLDEPRYARWSQASARAWAGFAEELGEAGGEALQLEQRGGYDMHFDEASLEAVRRRYEGLRAALGGAYPFEILGPDALAREEPGIGPDVAGAILHHEDGHVNPLRLLRALAADVRRRGGRVLSGRRVVDVDRPGGFRLRCADGLEIEAGKLVLAAGLGAAELGPKLGFRAPVRPQRGQVLITEKLPRFINRPSGTVRQVGEGGVQIGATNEEVGPDDGVTRAGLARMAAEAVRAYPRLARARLVRSWGALRVMSPDGLPIYHESAAMPGAFLVTCHSGITLAAAHALFLPAWLEGAADAPDLEVFGEDGFALS